MTLEKAFFILRHGSAEGEHKYFEAISVIESEYNRQKAEIERLEQQLETLCLVLKLTKKITKAEAIKEFAERVHAEIEAALKNNYEVRGHRMAILGVGETDQFVAQCTGKIYALRDIDDSIDNLAKEMVGDTE